MRKLRKIIFIIILSLVTLITTGPNFLATYAFAYIDDQYGHYDYSDDDDEHEFIEEDDPPPGNDGDYDWDDFKAMGYVFDSHIDEDDDDSIVSIEYGPGDGDYYGYDNLKKNRLRICSSKRRCK